MIWLVLFGVALLVSVTLFLLLGLLGGLMLMVILNGFSESQAMPIFVGYYLCLIGGNLLVTGGINWLILRHGFAVSGWSWWMAFLPGLVITLILLLAGPILSVAILKPFAWH